MRPREFAFSVLSLLPFTFSLNGDIQYICKQRCLLSPCAKMGSAAPPLVLIGGTAQSIRSWEHHLSALSRNRDVLVYECLGQGPLPPQVTINQDEYFSDVSLKVQADALATVVSSAFPNVQTHKVDVAGFSLGGRVALAAASAHPHLIRKLHITGVPAQRDAYARVILESWKDLLKSSDLTGYAWSTIFATHSEEFIAMNEARVKKWADFISSTNTVGGLLALAEQTHTEDEQNEWHPLSISQRIVSHGCMPCGRLAVGSNDKLAKVEQVQRLSKLLGWGAADVYDGVGHAVPLEEPRRWREDLLAFLDS